MPDDDAPALSWSAVRFASTCFLATAVGFGSYMGASFGTLLFVTTRSPRTALNAGSIVAILAGSLFGAAMTMGLYVSQRRAARLPRGSVLATRQSATFHVRCGIDRLRPILEQAHAALGGASRCHLEGGTLVVHGRTRLSWASWGEIVRIEAGPEAGGVVPVRVESRPILPVTIADRGKNRANVVAIRSAIRAGVSGPGVAPPVRAGDPQSP